MGRTKANARHRQELTNNVQTEIPSLMHIPHCLCSKCNLVILKMHRYVCCFVLFLIENMYVFKHTIFSA